MRICFFSSLLLILSANTQAQPEPLSLKEAIRMALQNNPDIQVAEIDPGIEQQKIIFAESMFDWEVRSSYNYENIDRPQNTQEFIATGGASFGEELITPRIFRERNHRGEFGFAKRLVNGTEVEIGTSVYSLDNTLNQTSPSSLFSPEWATFTGVSFTHPLLRGKGIDVNSAEIRIAKSNQKMATYEWQKRVGRIVSEVSKRYYDLVFANERLRVANESVGLASRLVEKNKALEEEGVGKRMDVLEAQVAVSAREETVLSAQSYYVERQNALRLLIQDLDGAKKQMKLQPTDRMQSAVSIPSRGSLMETALDKRLEIVQAREYISQQGIRTDYFENEKKPQLNLLGNVGVHGLAQDLGGSYGEAYEGQGPEWGLGFSFSKPWGKDSGAEAQVMMARLQKTQAKSQLALQEMTVALELDTVLSRIESNKKRMITAQQSTKLGEEALEAEMTLLSEGKSTSFEVLEMQTQLSAAKGREVAALADLNKAWVDLWTVTEQILEKNDVFLSDAKDADTLPSATPVAEAKAIPSVEPAVEVVEVPSPDAFAGPPAPADTAEESPAVSKKEKRNAVLRKIFGTR